MSLIKHCIVDTRTNKVVNIIEYETQQTSLVPGYESETYLLCVPSDIGGIDWDYVNNSFVDNRPKPSFPNESA
jgi:hypothetical protein